MFEETFLLALEVIGTFAAAVSGVRLAATKHFDWFGAYVVGLVTAIGGGTLRDLFLGIPIFWMVRGWYLGVTFIALLLVILFRKFLVRRDRMLLVFDTIGLAFFCVVGIQKSLAAGYDMWIAAVMGTITGAFGGVLRDILINDEPLVFRQDIYATACMAGCFAYWGGMLIGIEPVWQQVICAVTIILLRTLALRYKWQMPKLRSDSEETGI
ncbi:MAG: trimeric intracellular cation channel family protein [Muribaculaceae bacterium]|nr:trimeric intracellular cation channel family protein [Muribaculaceae bacterium]